MQNTNTDIMHRSVSDNSDIKTDDPNVYEVSTITGTNKIKNP